MFRITVNDSQVVKMLVEKLKMPQKLAEIFKDLVAPRMRQSFEQNFDSEGRPKWRALSAVTIEDRLRRGYGAGPILVRTGELKESVVTTRESITLAGNIVQMVMPGDVGGLPERYRYHQLGTQKMAQRKMIMFQLDDVEYILRVLNDRLDSGAL